MPNRKNAVLQIKKDAKRAERNGSVSAQLKTARKSFENILSQNPSVQDAEKAFTAVQSVVDVTCKKGILHPNKAARIKSRYIAKIKTMANTTEKKS